MTIKELPSTFEFVFLEEIKDAGFAFRLTHGSPYVYLSEKMRDHFVEDFNLALDEMVLMDYCDSSIDEIELDVLKTLRLKEKQHYGLPEEKSKTIADY
jgi:hypothetical protein